MELIREEDEENLSLVNSPKAAQRSPTPDPVKTQKKKDERLFKKQEAKKQEESIPKKPSVISQKIEPTLSTRIGLQRVNEGLYKPGEPRPIFKFPMTKKQREFFEKNRAYTSKKYFCKYGSVKISKPIPTQKVQQKISVPSPEASKAKVAPRKVTPAASRLYPYPQSEEELALKKPKSGIFINETKKKDSMGDYDSFDLVFTRTPRPKGKKRQKSPGKKGKWDDMSYEITEEGEGAPSKKKRRKRRKKQKVSVPEEAEEAEEEAETPANKENPFESYLTKIFRKKVSQMSQSTSYQSKDFKTTTTESVQEEPPLNKLIQKFRRESEIKKYQPRKRKIKRGTLESHSFTNINQPILKDFFFGCKQGTMHQGDASFPDNVRNLQGICMPVAAFCFSIITHPNKWTPENIDQILEYGNNLFLQCNQKLHNHKINKELKPSELQKYCTVGDKKIRFLVDDPAVVGMIRSEEKTVYNLTKGLNIFFAKNSAGILKTQEFNIAIWRDRYFYMFDALPRTKDLYCTPDGTALMANFYDIPSLVTVFLNHTNFGNWQFVIYPIKAFKVLNRDDLEVDSKEALNALKNYSILNERKAVLLGSFDLSDMCFLFNRGKQSLTMAVVSLVYSRITPPNAWQKSTVDKIMLLGNQLYDVCSECQEDEIRVDNLPAIFTIGPYIIEIYIYANIMADLLYKLCCCQLRESLEEFFKRATNAIIQVGAKTARKHIAVWQQRSMYYYFDPYSRNGEGFQCRDGSACVSMHSDLESVINTITANFDQNDEVFYIHALKVCKIHRDPAQTLKFPRHIPMDNFDIDTLKGHKMKKSKKAATEKPVSVDYTALAMLKLLAGEEMAPSVYEIGSTVESLNMEHCLAATRKSPSKSILASQPKIVDVIIDLDSPSLADTHVPPPIPPELRASPDRIEFLDLDSFAATMEEIEMALIEPEGEGEDYSKWYGKYRGEEEGDLSMEDLEEMGEGYDDWYYALAKFAQVGRGSLGQEPSKISEQLNTDITFFPIKREVLYPTYLRGKQEMKYRLQRYKFTEDDWDIYLPPEPAVTKSEELQKETNFIVLPDNTEIIHGTKNVATFGKDVDYMAPFICIMACVLSKKYSVLTWTTEIVDYLMQCGVEMYNASKFRYDQVSKLEIQKISIGDMSFTVLVEYIFDTYTRQNILEQAIEKILFVRSDTGILVTPVYTCALFYKNHLYYMYDCYGSNEVGLSEGPSNEGTACFSRFKDIRSLATRIMYNKKKREKEEEISYSRFVLSSVKVKEILSLDDEKGQQRRKTPTATSEEEDEEKQDSYREFEGKEEGEERVREEPVRKDKATVIVGYRLKNKNYIIEGSRGLGDRGEITGELKEDHFICLVACLKLIGRPINKWDNKRVDKAIECGKRVFSHADDLEFSEKRVIKNILVDKHFFDVIVKKVKIENWKDRTSVYKGIDTLLSRRMQYFLLQFPNACYVIHKSQNGKLHIFDPYDVAETGHAGWLRCNNVKTLKKKLKKLIVPGGEGYQFYNFEVTSIQKAPKEVLLNYKLMEYDMEEMMQKERFGKYFYEDVEWLKQDPIPWTRRSSIAANGKKRGTIDNLWNAWDIEYHKDLYSLMGNIHQFSTKFSDETRGKQTLANLVVCIGMMEIYDLEEWNPAVIDSVLVNGDNYFSECIQDLTEEDYEISIDDLKPECTIFPFSFTVSFNPIVEGTMFLVRTKQFNLYKALRYFFNNYTRRCGIICLNRTGNKRQVAFGKLRESEYFMFDSELTGGSMFLEGCGVGYVLRATTLNRLLHVLTLTLRGGDFYIYEVEVNDLKPIS